MKKRKTILAAVLAAVLTVGCAGAGGSSAFKADKSGIYVSRDGICSSATVETYDDSGYYDQEGLKAEIQTAVDEYNGGHGGTAVTLKSCSLADGKAAMAFDYASGADLVEFANNYEDTVNALDSLQITTAGEAGAAGLLDGVSFVKLADGKAADLESIKKNGDYRVIIAEGGNPVTIRTEGKIQFTSEGIACQDSYTATTAAGKTVIIFK